MRGEAVPSAPTAPPTGGAGTARGSLYSRLAAAGPAVVIGAVAVAFPLVFGSSQYYMSIATECVVYSLVTISLNLLIGIGGQISLGQAGLVAIGGYSGGYLLERYPSLPFPLELGFAALITTVAGLLLGLPTGRLRGHYLAVLTLGLGVAVPQISLNLDSITGGRSGLIVAPAHIGGWTFSGLRSQYFLILTVTALCVLGVLSLLKTRTGRAFTAVRDSEQAAAAMGINVQRTKVVLFATSAGLAGVAGDLFAHANNLVSPDSFPFSLSLFFLAAVVVGGLGSVWGSVAGAVAFVLADTKSSTLPGFEPLILGALVIVVLLVAPGGIAGLGRLVVELSERRRGGPPDPGED